MKKKFLLLIEPMIVFFVISIPLFNTVGFLSYERPSVFLPKPKLPVFIYPENKNMSVDFLVIGKTEANCVHSFTKHVNILKEYNDLSQMALEKDCDCSDKSANDQIQRSDISPYDVSSGGLTGTDYPSPGELTKPQGDDQDGFQTNPYKCNRALDFHRECPPPNRITIIEMGMGCSSSIDSDQCVTCGLGHCEPCYDCCSGIAEGVSRFNLSLLDVYAQPDSLSTIIETRFFNRVITQKRIVHIDGDVDGTEALSRTYADGNDRPIHIIIPFKVVSNITLRPVIARLVYSTGVPGVLMPHPIHDPDSPNLYLRVEWRVIEIDPVNGSYIQIVLENVTQTLVNIFNNPNGTIDMRGQYGSLYAGKTYILDVKYIFDISVGDLLRCVSHCFIGYSRFDLRFE
jgi:hypothetical protein